MFYNIWFSLASLAHTRLPERYSYSLYLHGFAYTNFIPFSYVLILILSLSYLRKFYSCKSALFSIAVHVFRNFFLQNMPSRQISITYLKCCRAFFSPFSYSEKMRWDRGWKFFEIIVVSRMVQNSSFYIRRKLYK